MNIWGILGIEYTSDKAAIKKAYRAKLKVTHPEEHPKEFMELREAYEKAMEAAVAVLPESDNNRDDNNGAHGQRHGGNGNDSNFKGDIGEVKDGEDEEGRQDAKAGEDVEDSQDVKVSWDVKGSEDAESGDDEEGFTIVDRNIIREYNINRQVDRWWNRVSVVLADFEKRCDTKEWEKLLYEELPYQIIYFEKCRERLKNYLFHNDSRNCYLPDDIMRLIDRFFVLSPEPSGVRDISGRRLYNHMRNNPMLDFDHVIMSGSVAIDPYFQDCNRWAELKSEYLALVSVKDEAMRKKQKSYESQMMLLEEKLKKKDAVYLPLECALLSERLNALSEEIRIGIENVHKQEIGTNNKKEIKNNENEIRTNNKKEIKTKDEIELKKEIEAEMEHLLSLFGTCDELRLLQAEVMLKNGDTEAAKKALHELYLHAPLKNILYLCRLSYCCQQAGMYFEAYMLTKQLSWISEYDFVEKRAEALYRIMNEEYCRKLETGQLITDEEKIHMCRMYLRSNREKDAAEILSEVSEEGRTGWHYHMAACLVYFNEEVFQPEVRSFNALEKYDKSNLGNIEWLEWEELKVRYLFEQKKYEACIAECNRWLNEYPMSLVMMTLRGLADYLLRNITKQYMDIEYLVSIYPKRTELRLILAEYQWYLGYDEDMKAVLEPVKEQCVIPYEFSRIMNDGNNAYGDERKKEWYQLLTKLKKQEYNIPFFSKYALHDLNRVYSRIALSMYAKNDGEIYARLQKVLSEQIEAMPDCPEKYSTLSFFYKMTVQNHNMLKTALKAIESVTSKEDLAWYYGRLLDVYADLGEFDKLEEIGKKLCVIDEEGYKRVFASYSNHLNGTDEVLFARLEAYCERYAKEMTALSHVRTVARFYEKLGILTNDVSKFRKGIELVEPFPKTFGYVGDDGEDECIYMWLGRLYARCGMKKEALGCIDRMYRYANDPDIPLRNLHLIAEIYELLEMFDKAEEYYLKAEKQGIVITAKILRMYLKSGNYRKARERFSGDDAGDKAYVQHTLYLEKGFYDRKELKDVTDLLEAEIKEYKKTKSSRDVLGDKYLMMTELLYYLGDEKRSEYYRKKAEKFQWNSMETKQSCFVRTDLWILWYQKKYREALELIDSNRSALTCRHIEVAMFHYQLQKMNLR